MEYTNLKDSPEFVQKTYNLIEESFEYTKENSFNIDFYPLMEKSNHHNCYIYIDDNEVIAHIGVLERSLIVSNKTFNFTMYGGIAVRPSHRGKGLFKTLFHKVLLNFQKSTFHLLWSEKVELYKKYEFYPCVLLNEFKQHKTPFQEKVIQTKLKDLSSDDYKSVRELYDNLELRMTRESKHWESIQEISSTELYLVKSDSKVTNYFFKGKGQDLTNIIHEYGVMNKKSLELMRNHGNVWTTFNDSPPSQILCAALLRVGNEVNFKDFINSYTGIEIQEFSKGINFKFSGNNYSFNKEEFLQGVFGPGRFEELKAPFLYISGLDSI